MFDNDKMLAKIRGLLAKADRTDNAAEAETFREKAFELLAKYGIDEAMATRGGTTEEDVEGNKLKAVTFTVRDAYAEERILLIWGIARSLHCAGIRLDVDKVQIWGVTRHVRRVRFLYDLLHSQMVSEASRARPKNPFAVGLNTMTGDVKNVTQYRADFMLGFSNRVSDRLRAQEARAAGMYDGTNGGSEAALMLADDYNRALAAMRKRYPNTSAGKARTGHGEGYGAGQAAGNRADVGNTRVGGTKVAIG